MAQGFLDRVLQGIWSLRRATGEALSRQPLWPDVVRICRIAVSPVKGFARALLKIFPFLRHLEWLLELQALTRRHPVPLALALAYVFWRGIRVTHLGHIGTDPMIYPFMAVLSGFNPCLGFAAGVIYGVGDLVQKFFRPDIYGVNMGRADPNFWPSMGGYAVAYSSLICMGVLPGVSARVMRLLVVRTMSGITRSRAAAHADGAGGATSFDPASGGDAITLAGVVAAAAGGGLAGYLVMDSVAPVLESPAFMWRPNPDVSCMRVETGILTGHAGGGMRAGGAGGLVQVITPPTPPPPPPPTEEGPPETPQDWERTRERIEVYGVPPAEPPGDPGAEVWYPRVERGVVEDEPATVEHLRTERGQMEDMPPEPRRRPGAAGEGSDAEEVELEGREAAVSWEDAGEGYGQEPEPPVYDAEDAAERDRMLSQGWKWDPYQDAWRKPPDPVGFVNPQHEDVEVVHYRPFHPEEGASTQQFENRLQDLEDTERNCLDDFARLDEQREEARRNGDRWLEEQLTAQVDRARQNVAAVQREKDSLVARADREQRYVDDRQDVTVGEVVVDSWHMTGQIVKDVFDPDYSFTVHQMQRAIDARSQLLAESGQLEGRWQEQDELMARYRELKNQFDASDDPTQRQRLSEEAAALRGRFQGMVSASDRFQRTAGEYVQEAARADLTGIAAGTDMGMRGGAALSSARMVHRLVDPDSAIPWTPHPTSGPDTGPEALYGTERSIDAGAASPEAMSRMRVNRLFRVDTNTGQVTEMLGPAAVDTPLAPHEVLVIRNTLTGTNAPAGVGRNFEVSPGGRSSAFDRAFSRVDSHVAAGETPADVSGGGPDLPPRRWEAAPASSEEGASAGGAGEPPSDGGGLPPEGSGPGARGDPDLARLARTEPGSESVVQRKVASAEEKAELLRQGKPLPDAGRELPTTYQDWQIRDRVEGVAGGGPRVNQLQVLGVERPPEVELVARGDPAFAQVDDLVRDAYRRSGGGFNLPGDTHWRWENFQANLSANGVSEEAFSAWLDKVGAIKYTPAGETIMPDTLRY